MWNSRYLDTDGGKTILGKIFSAFISGKMQDLIEGCVKYTVAPAVSKAEYDQTPM